MTFLEHIEQYLEWKSTYTSRAYVNYRPWLLRLAKSVGQKSLDEITLEDVVHYRKLLDNKYQPYTIQLAMVAVHNFFKWCSIMKYDTVSAGLVRVPRTQARPRPVVYPEDFKKMCDFYEGKDDFLSIRNVLILKLLWDTGMRVSELCDLNVEEMILTNREATVRTRKSNKLRQIYWSVETNTALIRYLKIRKELSSSPALFIGLSPAKVSVRIKQRSIQRIIVSVSREVGLSKVITPHSFRHGKAHRILNMGGNPKHIQAILGHSETNPMASFAYLHFNNEETRLASRRFLGETIDSQSNSGESGSMS